MITVTVIKANKREIPAAMPPTLWWAEVGRYEKSPRLTELPWYLPTMEYLTPDEILRVRAKAFVWFDETGDWPTDISCWWEVRMARRRGDLPASTDYVVASWNNEGSLVCGHCGARWAKNKDGSDWDDTCNLCGVNWTKEGVE